MPELPEVEVTRLSFARQIEGASVEGMRLGKPLRWPLGIAPEMLTGARVLAVRRRGKYLLMDLDRGLLLIHLGMSGSLAFARSLPPPGPHDHWDMETTRGMLRLNDPRRFGAVVFAESQEAPVAQKLLGKLGMEPLSDEPATGFHLEAFSRGLKKRAAPIKQVLLAGELVVGVGNIYASEALFQAGIRPTVKARSVSVRRATLLHGAIQSVLARAVARGGSTLRDFSAADGQAGHFQLEANVYGREGLPCRVCGGPIKAIRQGQRSTFFCPFCQKS